MFNYNNVNFYTNSQQTGNNGLQYTINDYNINN